MKKKLNVLIVSSDSIGDKMAGPGIRYFQIASQMSKYHNITLLIPNDVEDLKNADFQVMRLNKKTLMNSCKAMDIILIQGMTLFRYPSLKKFRGSLVIDLYDPTMLEMLELRNNNFQYKVDLDIVLEQLKYGDYFICASEKQKDLWIGMLLAIGRIKPSDYIKDKNLTQLIGMVPFGIEKVSPIKKKNPYLELPNIKETDKVLLWGGGIWDWLDPLIIIEAMQNISKKRDDIKLVFMGTKHPSQSSILMQRADEAIELARKYNLVDRFVFFYDWVPYKSREQFLLHAHVGVSFHINHLETRYSFRTRVLDYIWCELPMILTEGDLLSEIIQKNNCGIVVKENNIPDVIGAILRLVEEPDFYKQMKKNTAFLKEDYFWENTIKDLLKYCNNTLSVYKKSKGGFRFNQGLKIRYYFSKVPMFFTKKGQEKALKILLKKKI